MCVKVAPEKPIGARKPTTEIRWFQFFRQKASAQLFSSFLPSVLVGNTSTVLALFLLFA